MGAHGRSQLILYSNSLHSFVELDCKSSECVRFEVLTAIKMSVSVFWFVASYRLLDTYQSFGDIHLLHLQGFVKDADSMVFPEKTFIYLQIHTAIQSGRPKLTSLDVFLCFVELTASTQCSQ